MVANSSSDVLSDASAAVASAFLAAGTSASSAALSRVTMFSERFTLPSTPWTREALRQRGCARAVCNHSDTANRATHGEADARHAQVLRDALQRALHRADLLVLDGQAVAQQRARILLRVDVRSAQGTQRAIATRARARCARVRACARALRALMGFSPRPATWKSSCGAAENCGEQSATQHTLSGAQAQRRTQAAHAPHACGGPGVARPMCGAGRAWQKE
jgi:hypothetical protein